MLNKSNLNQLLLFDSALTGVVFVISVAIMAVSYVQVVRVLIRHRRSRTSTTSAVYTSKKGFVC